RGSGSRERETTAAISAGRGSPLSAPRRVVASAPTCTATRTASSNARPRRSSLASLLAAVQDERPVLAERDDDRPVAGQRARPVRGLRERVAGAAAGERDELG